MKRREKVENDMQQDREEREEIDMELGRRLLASEEPLQDVVRQYSQKVELQSRIVAARGDAKRPAHHQLTGRAYHYETPAYMTNRPAFRYGDESDSTSALSTQLLLQSLRSPEKELPRGGGYTGQFWRYRLRHFCE